MWTIFQVIIEFVTILLLFPMFFFFLFFFFFFFFDFEACEILATQTQMEPVSLASHGKALTTGPLGRSLVTVS